MTNGQKEAFRRTSPLSRSCHSRSNGSFRGRSKCSSECSTLGSNSRDSRSTLNFSTSWQTFSLCYSAIYTLASQCGRGRPASRYRAAFLSSQSCCGTSKYCLLLQGRWRRAYVPSGRPTSSLCFCSRRRSGAASHSGPTFP